MSDQSKLGIGKIITSDQFRDAIHVAVAPVEASDPLLPGEHVGLKDGKAVDSNKATPIGIVDPFIERKAVLPGERFWLFLYPGSITSLRHEWSHPSFEGKSAPEPLTEKQQSEAWIRECAARDCDGISFAQLMLAADDFVRCGEYLIQGGRFEGIYLPEEFWKHYQILREVEVPESKQSSFFSCSC